MALPVFRSLSQAGGSTATNITGTEPSGGASGDIYFATLYIESDTAVTPPSGWSNTFNGTAMLAECNTAGKEFRLYGYWIRRGASAPALQWTFASSFRGLVIEAYSGARASGDPWSFGVTAVKDNTTGTTFPAASGTTLDNEEKLVWSGGGFNGGSASAPPTNFEERLDMLAGPGADVTTADKDTVTLGATGSITGASYTGTAGPTAVLLAGLRPASPSAIPMVDSVVGTSGNKTGSITAPTPAGAVSGDIYRVDIYQESDTEFTPPSGWSNVFGSTTGPFVEANNAGGQFRHYTYWIRRGSTEPSLVWTFSGTVWCNAAIRAYRGALASGNPWSFVATAVRDNASAATYPDVSGMTSDNNEKLLWVGSHWVSPTAGVPPTGFTERDDAGEGFEGADKDQATAGATGTVTGASYSGDSNNTAGAIMTGLRPAATGATVSAPTTTATYTCAAPQVRGKVASGVVLATYTAIAPQVRARVAAGVASATYTAIVPQVRAAVAIGVASVTYTAIAPAASARVQSGAAVHTYAPEAPTFPGTNGVGPPVVSHAYAGISPAVKAAIAAGFANVVYTMLTPAARASVAPGAASSSYQATAPAVRASVAAGPAIATYTAIAPAASSRVQPGAAAHTYTGAAPSVNTGGTLAAVPATHSYAPAAPALNTRVAANFAAHTYTGVVPPYIVTIRFLEAMRARIGTSPAVDTEQRIGTSPAVDTEQRIGEAIGPAPNRRIGDPAK